MIEAELFDGTVLEFPDGTRPEVIQRVVKQQTAQKRGVTQPGQVPVDANGVPTGPQAPPRADAPPSPPATPVGPQGFADTATGLLAALGDGARQGVATILGAPVDLLNNSPRLLNLLPGVSDVPALMENPFGGRATMDAGLRGWGGLAAAPFALASDTLFGTDSYATLDKDAMGLPVLPDFQPRTGPERIANRIGEEVGASVLPVGGAIAKASTMPVATVNRMASAPASVGEGVAAQFLQPAAVSPLGLAGREGLYAGGAGLGAGLANEAAGDNAGMLSDMLGSILGAGAMGTLGALGGGAMNLAAGATGSPKFADDVASSAVAERLMNSSTGLQEQAARLKDAGVPATSLSTDDLVRALRSPAAVEQAVPGYRANIADRTVDPGLATLAYNTDAVSPGAASARRVGNEAAVNERMAAMTPEGDPARFRSALQSGVDTQIGTAIAAQGDAESAFDDIVAALQPTMRDASARGSSIRSALADAYSSVQNRVRGLYGQIDADGTLMDPTTLVERAKGVDMNLAPNDAKRFRPTEASTIQEMMPGARAPLRDTGLVNEFNRPVFAENGRAPANPNGVPAMPGEAIGRPGTTVPMSDISAIRTGLTDDLRAAQAAGQTQQARVLNKYIDAVDGYLDENLPAGLRSALDEARAARRDQGERFERPGTALEAILSKREGGGFALDDSAVPGKIAQPDQGRVSDMKAAFSETRNVSDPPIGTGFEGWVDSFYTPQSRTSGRRIVREGTVYRGVSPQELANAKSAGAFRALGGGVFVEPDPTRYVGGGAYGAKGQGAIVEFDVSGLTPREMKGGRGTGDTLGYDEIPMSRVKRIWGWDPQKGEHTLAYDAAPSKLDPRMSEGLADEVRSQVVQGGLLDKPKQLGKFLSDRQILLADFPELRMQLEQAGATREALTAAEKAAAETTKRLTTPGRSAEASYLKNVEDPAAAIRSVTSSPDPRKAVADLVATARSPQAKTDLRAALWEEVKRTGKLQADGMTGETRWNGKKLRAMFDDPKFSAVAEELWKDDPEDLANIKTVFNALAGAEGSVRARAPNTSGTAQSLSGRYDAALTASAVASRARNVSRGVVSPTVTVIDIMGTWLRRRSAMVQSRAIDQITAAVVNNPGLAADLLERYNPATAAARRKMLTQKYGVRATTILNVLDEAENEDPVLDAVEEK